MACFPLKEKGDYLSDLVSMNLGAKGKGVPTSHAQGLLATSNSPIPASRNPQDPLGPSSWGSKFVAGPLRGPICYKYDPQGGPTHCKVQRFTTQPPTPPGAIFPGRKVQTREQSTTQLLPVVVQQPCPIWLGLGRGRCQAWQGDAGDGKGRGPGTHCSLEPAGLGFQDNLREGKGRYWALSLDSDLTKLRLEASRDLTLSSHQHCPERLLGGEGWEPGLPPVLQLWPGNRQLASISPSLVPASPPSYATLRDPMSAPASSP